MSSLLDEVRACSVELQLPDLAVTSVCRLELRFPVFAENRCWRAATGDREVSIDGGWVLEVLAARYAVDLA
jgi:hypothetical protein